MSGYGYDTFLSPMTWRYGSAEMRRLWSEEGKRRLYRRIWASVAAVQAEAGLVSPLQARELEKRQDDIDMEASLELERSLRHDLMAELRTYAAQCPEAGGAVHLGCTSADIEDNADALRTQASLRLLRSRLRGLLQAYGKKIRETHNVLCMAFTHIQSAEPTTVGYRLAQTAQDLLTIDEKFQALRIKGKGFKGAVGTGASFAALLEGRKMGFDEFEAKVLGRLGLEAYEVSTQVYPRLQDLETEQLLCLLAAALHKAALDLRVLQSSGIGEAAEPFAPSQVGSSAMPFKRNPVLCEKVCSLCRLVRSLSANAWDNAAGGILERTLDDSANRRVFLPEAFLAMDECLATMTAVIKGLRIDKEAIKRNLERFGVFAATERLLMRLGARGADRQRFHEVIRKASLEAWANVEAGRPNNLAGILSSDSGILAYMTPSEVLSSLDVSGYCGIAPARALAMADRIEARVGG